MSKVQVDAIEQQCGSTLTVGGGAGKTVTVDATTVTLGRCGATVSLASGASQSGFGRTGTVDWQTSSIKTATFTATNGEGYFCNTSGGAFTVNLPAGSAGAIVSVSDYTRTFQTNTLTVAPNGSEKIGGVAADAQLTTEGQTATFVYVDSTEGWINIQETSNSVIGNNNLIATGGTITTCGNCKIHKFTGPGTFTVSQVSPCAANNLVSYMVVAGGASGGGSYGGGGGAGGFRELVSPTAPYTASPLNGYPTPGNRITVTATGYPITVGGGGAAVPGSPHVRGNNGNTATFSTITSAGGGAGGAGPSQGGSDGGSGGGAGRDETTNNGSGNVPPVTPPQGNNGGQPAGSSWNGGGGGGGATAVGGNGDGGGPSCETAGPGGAGATTCISATPTGYAGGGGGSNSRNNPPTGTATQGGGAGYNPARSAGAGTVNTGGGGGGSHGCTASGAGGSGIVIIRYKYQ